MEKDVLGNKIKHLRTGKGYSQEHLADLSQISLRTVQRIENGETEARGDTLNRLAKALTVGIDELIPNPSTPQDGATSNDGYIALINLAGLACLFVYIPIFGFVVPLIMWLLKKDSMPDVKEKGKKILNFQLTWLITFLLLFVFVLFFVGRIFRNVSAGWALGIPEMILLSIYIFVLFNVVMVIINTIRIITHKELMYWPAIRFLK